MVDFKTTKTAAAGRWIEILQYLGVPSESLTGKHCHCPGCGGRDRFRWDAGKEAFFCGGGGNLTGGDGFSLLKHIGFSKADALHAVAQYLNLDRVMLSPEQRQEIEQRRQTANLERFEAELLHEMRVLGSALIGRVNDRVNSKNPQFIKENPH